MARKRNLIVCLLAAVAIAGLAAAYWQFHRERWKFEDSIRVGMSRNQVEHAVGTPTAILKPGDTLEKWGNSPAQIAREETWVYHVKPASQHRFVVTFSGDKASKIDYEGN